MSNWLLVVLLGLQAHFAASYIMSRPTAFAVG
jgi:hypothetical protein